MIFLLQNIYQKYRYKNINKLTKILIDKITPVHMKDGSQEGCRCSASKFEKERKAMQL